MTKREILIAYKEGNLSVDKVQEKLRELRQLSSKAPLSECQKGLWMLYKMSPGMSAYNIPVCFRIKGKLDSERFKQACCFVLQQYPILNTVIRESDGVPYQMILMSQPLFFQQEDVSTLKPDEILPYLKQKVKEPFSLENGPLMRIQLFSCHDEEHIVLITIHHIIFDGSSMLLLVSTLLDYYRELVKGINPVPDLPLTSFNDFVLWEQSMLSGPKGLEDRSYWKKQMSGDLPVLELPLDKPRLPVQSFNGQTYTYMLPTALSSRAKSFARTLHLNFSTLLLGVLKVMLHQYTGQEDIIVGMPVIGRPLEQFDALVGYFINMVPIRSRQVGIQPFSKFISELQMNMADALDHSAFPFPMLVRELGIPRTPVNSPVFQVAFFYQNFSLPSDFKNFQERFKGMLSIEFIEELHQEGEYEFALEVFERAEGFVLNIKYNPDLFAFQTIERMMKNYAKLMEEVINEPSLLPSEYGMMSNEERDTLLVHWNATREDYPADKCFHELFEEQVAKTPDAVAVVYEEESLTYNELNDKSTQVALYLQKHGVKPDCPVGICIKRSLKMVIGLLGILKAGGAYVPLDPDYPAERLEYMTRDSGITLILTQSELMDKVSGLKGKKVKAIALDGDWAEIEYASEGEENLEREVKSNHLAYVIYTSGSTGKPKGVMVPHKGLTNFLVSMGNTPGLTSRDRLLAVTTYCFDIAGLELYLPLIKGAQCRICSAEKTKDAELLKNEIKKYRPTIMQATPVTWIMLFSAGWENKEKTRILCGGEALSEELKQQFINYDCDVWNMYGPTETTIWSTVLHISANKPVTIGKPIANTQVYVLDKRLRPVPVGVPGELCIAGDGLARGYINQPELTEEKFIDNPFKPGTKLYKTGDLASWLSDGNIGYLGRIDYQVKLRGYRIELGEIESRLRNYPGIKDCVVVLKGQEPNKQLIAYYIAKDREPVNKDGGKGAFEPQHLRRYLKLNLPEYMIPVFFVRLDEIPLTLNGKIDRKELMNRKVELQREKTVSIPRSKIEEKIFKIWSEVLKIENISIEDHFFNIGGDSLLAVIVIDRIRKDFDCDINITSLFKYSNIKELSAYVAQVKGMHGGSGSGQDRTLQFEKPNIEGLNIIKDDERSRLAEYYQDSIAIIGISCHFPGAKNHFEFWNNLREGKEGIRSFSKEELRALGLGEEMIENPDFIPVQSTIEDKDLFDPGFFNISPRDAAFMDPQMRLLLLHSWKAIEDAGYTPGQIPETSVFMSASNNFYQAPSQDASSMVMQTSEEYVSWIYGQAGTIPTMVSHKLGLKGPSFFVHSNCSSSLSALYSAYQGLRTGETQYALVGGSSIFSSNLGYIYQPGLNFSGDGHCRAFDASADGMVTGEGVAVILLKRACDAICDRDHIYGIMRGIGLNNDGADKVGFYAPSVKGQTNVIKKVLDATQIHPESISYIEAHGTGTKLGDPIEFAALCDSYGRYTEKRQFCGIGSVKTNIGHLDTAAGLAGCIKLVLSLYHNELPPSLHYKEQNPNINLESSPFYVVDRLKKWENVAVPHRAALSSFGIGGTNAHAIFEEYRLNIEEEPAGSSFYTDFDSYLIPLSAKNGDRLKAYTHKLVDFLKAHQEHIHPADMAYTLQIGREPMESRIVFIVKDIDELIHKLEGYNAGTENIEDCFKGEAKKVNDAVRLLQNDEYCGEILRRWISRGEVRKIAEFWAKGLRVDWEDLYPGLKPRRISLPTYSFSKERYWISQEGTKPGSTVLSATPADAIHPLLHKNKSSMVVQRYSSTFTGHEFFLKDHVIKGQRVLPGVAYLEMARAAVEAAVEAPVNGCAGIRLRNVVWARPITVGSQPVQVHIELSSEDNFQISYGIYSESGRSSSEPVLHSQGIAVLGMAEEAQVIDLKALQAECGRDRLTAKQCYMALKNMGIDYGPAFEGLNEVYVGDGQVLAKLSLPSAISHTIDWFFLHPSMVDSALQALIGLMWHGATDGTQASIKPILPFSLQELEIISRCTSKMWAYIRDSDGTDGEKVKKLDIDLCDSSGKICVRMKEFSSRVLEGGIQMGDVPGTAQGESFDEPLVGNVMLTPVWDVMTVDRSQRLPGTAGRIVIVGGSEEEQKAVRQHYPHADLLEIRSADTMDDIAEKLNFYGLINNIVWIAPHGALASLADDRLIKEQYGGVLKVFRMVKALLNLEYGSRELEWTLITVQTQPVDRNDDVNPAHAGIHGLMGSLAKEYQNWKIRVVDLEEGCDWSTADIFTLPADLRGDARVYRRKQWHMQKLIPTRSSAAGHTLYRTEGVYVVIGGAGGIGEAWSEYMIMTYKAHVVWIGRRKMDEAIRVKLDRLAGLGPCPCYISADATDLKALQRAYKEIKHMYARIHGVVHSAIVLKDKGLAGMEEESFKDGLIPKVDISVRLAQVFQKENLDFVMFFSSIQSFTKSPGQSNYAAGCTFKDAFAHQLSREWSCAVKVINWGYWGSVGIVSSKAYQDKMAQAGIGSIEPPEAMAALEYLLVGPMDRIAMVKTSNPLAMQEIISEELVEVYPEDRVLDVKKVYKRVSSIVKGKKAPSVYYSGAGGTTGLLQGRVEASLIKIVSKLLKVRIQDIDTETELSEYGFDKSNLAQLSNEINREFNPELTTAMLADCRSISNIAEYLTKKKIRKEEL